MKSQFIKIFLSLLIWINPGDYLNPAFASAPPDKKVEALIEQGDKHFEEGFLYQAIQFYQQALNLAPDYTYAHYQLGECYRNLFEYQKAKNHYERVYKENRKEFPSSGYYLALMLKLSGDYARSITYFDSFMAYAEKEKFKHRGQLLKQAQLEKDGSLLALQNTIKPKGLFGFTRLPAPVNTEYNDYAATFYQNNSGIAITSTRSDTKGRNINDQYGEYYSDHYLFAKDEAGEWKDISKQNNFSAINTNYSEGTGVFNKDKTIFYFTGCYQEGFCHLYKSELKNDKWQSPVSLGGQVNVKGYDSKQPAISPGGDTLFFVSNRPGGIGMLDIWMSTLSADGTWQAPVNMGPGVNTAQNELSPFYSPQGKALFFSSNGYKGYGGFDVFITPILSGTGSPSSINLGMPFNSFKDDLYLSLGEKIGYLSSNRANDDGNFDIYTFDITTSEAVLLSLQKGQHSETNGILRFFSEEDRSYFQELPLEEKTKVQQLIEQQSFRQALAEKAVLSEALSFFYESLTTEEKKFIESLSTIQKKFLLNESQDGLLAEDPAYSYYENLPTEKKEKVKQIIETHAFRKILQDKQLNDPQLRQFYERLPLEERERIDRAIEERGTFVAKSFLEDGTPTLNDLFYYQSLPSAQKEKVAQIIAAQFFKKENTNSREVAYEQEMTYEQLPLEEKQRIDRMVNARRFTTKKAAEEDASPEMYFEHDYLNIGALAMRNPEKITIEGRLLASDKPADAIKVRLVSGREQKEKVAVTNQEGEFAFVNVTFSKDQEILFDQEASFMQLTQLALEELKVTVLQDTIINERFDNIYFETNQYTINDSSKVILDKLADFHFRFPDVQIEISGYADTTGGAPYNKQLSFKRASEAYTYLVDKGVAQAALHVLPMGKEMPQEGKDLGYSRRIEFDLHAVSSSYNPTREVYIISPKPDLKEIAARHQLSLPELMEMNKQIEGEPAPFTPVRVLFRRK